MHLSLPIGYSRVRGKRIAQVKRKKSRTGSWKKGEEIGEDEGKVTHKTPLNSVLAKKSRSAEGRIKAGSFPPSSIQVGAIISAAAAATYILPSADTEGDIRQLAFLPTDSLPMTDHISVLPNNSTHK